MKNSPRNVLLIALLIPILSGCVKLVTQFSPSLIPNLTQTFFEECDPELARLSFPADLKLMEGLVKNDPQNKQLLTALCMGFTGYSMLFVEEEDPERASLLYLRARGYGLKALGRKGAFLKESGLNAENIRAKLNTFGEREFKALFYTTMSWHAWINLNLDKPAALAQMGIAQACLERVLELNPGYLYGAPYVLMGTILAARPGLAGGDALKAKVYFEKAIEVSKGKFYFVQYYFARYYAVRIQDRRLFRKLAQEAVQGHPSELKDACLINSVMQQKAKKLLDMTEDLFL
ncbi:MAG: TRAP transporter TatT component family protein [Pseudomonadota bacterium]